MLLDLSKIDSLILDNPELAEKKLRNIYQKEYDPNKEYLVGNKISHRLWYASHLNRLSPPNRDNPLNQQYKQPNILELHQLAQFEINKNPIVAPGLFWEEHISNHLNLLNRFGLENFKRTVGHNYINFLPNGGLLDKQFQSQLNIWGIHQSPYPLSDQGEMPNHVGFSVASTGKYLLSNQHIWSLYKFLVSLQHDHAILIDELQTLCHISEPSYGNPLDIFRGNKRLSQDLSHSSREYNLIMQNSIFGKRPRILEIGSGYGRLAHFFMSMGACQKYVLVDISPALFVAQNYLNNLYKNHLKIFNWRPFIKFEEIQREFDESDICFLTPNQISLLPNDYFSLTINVCSLMEMRFETINYYLKEINRLNRGYFFTKQWVKQNNKQDKTSITKNDYPIPQNWKRIIDRVDSGYTSLFVQLWAT